jgi:hypothetical protein
VLDAIAANRELWESTVFILNYDENDGLFDHVVPPTPPTGTPDEFVTKTSPVGTPGDDLPVGLGFRVPCTQISAWRHQTVSDLTGAFDGRATTPSCPCIPTPTVRSSWPTTRPRWRCLRFPPLPRPSRSSRRAPGATPGSRYVSRSFHAGRRGAGDGGRHAQGRKRNWRIPVRKSPWFQGTPVIWPHGHRWIYEAWRQRGAGGAVGEHRQRVL